MHQFTNILWLHIFGCYINVLQITHIKHIAFMQSLTHKDRMGEGVHSFFLGGSDE